MKKTYDTPIIAIKKFQKDCLVTLSGTTNVSNVETELQSEGLSVGIRLAHIKLN